jgi:hypothetical protein
VGNESFFGANAVGQESWERRGQNEGRIRALETRLNTAEAELVLIDSGAWTPYTPTMSWTLGNGTLTGKYCRMGRAIFFDILLVLGSTTTASGNLTFGVPAAMVDTDAAISLGSTMCYDATGPTYCGPIAPDTANAVYPMCFAVVGSFIYRNTVTVSRPINTFSVGDRIHCRGFYEAIT